MPGSSLQVCGIVTDIDVIKHHGSTDPLILVSVLMHHGVPKEEVTPKSTRHNIAPIPFQVHLHVPNPGS